MFRFNFVSTELLVHVLGYHFVKPGCPVLFSQLFPQRLPVSFPRDDTDNMLKFLDPT